MDVNKFKSRLVNLSQTMRNFKTTLSTQALSEEQIAVDKELNDFSTNLDRYFLSKHNIINSTVLSTCTTMIRNTDCLQPYEETRNLHKLLAKTGHTGNWTDKDHLLFLRMRKKYKTIPALVKAIQTKCPDLSAETIINHESWYNIYLDLRKKQQLKLRDWRARKEEDKMKKVSGHDNLNVNLVEDIMLQKDAHIAVNSAKLDNCFKFNIEKEKPRAKKWKKTDKRNQCAVDDQQFKSYLLLKEAPEEKCRQVKLKKVQQRLNEYKTKRQLETESTQLEAYKNHNNKYKPDATLMFAYREQDKEYMRRKMDMILRARKSGRFVSSILHHKPVTLSRSSTLFNPTIVSNEKSKRNITSQCVNVKNLLYIKDIPRTCVRWRNEESIDLNIL